MQFDPVRIAAIGKFLEKNTNAIMGEVFRTLEIEGYSFSEIRQGFNVWIASKYQP